MAKFAESAKPRLVVDSESEGGGVGAILRGARLARGEELREVAAALRIRLPYLEALEAGRLDELPGMTYGIGFVRAYADHMGLDSADLILRFKLEARGINRKTELQFPEPLPSNRVPSGALLLIALLLAGGVYGGWLYSTSQDMTLVEAIKQVPERLLSLGGESDPASAPIVAEETLVTPPPAPAEALPAQEAVVEETVAVAPEAPVTEIVEPDAAPAEAAVIVSTAEEAAAATVDVAETATASPEAAVDEAPVVETPATALEAEATPEPAAAPEATPEPVAQPEEVTPEPAAVAEAATAEPSPVEAPENAPEPPAVAELTPDPDTVPDPGRDSETVIQIELEAPPVPQPEAQPGAQPETQPGIAPVPEPEATPEIVEEALPPPVVEEPVVAEVTQEPAAPVEVAEEDLPPPESVVEDVAASDEPEPAVPFEDASVATAPAEPEPEVAAAAPPTRARIILQATSESWIRVTDSTGAVLIEKLLLMGEIYRVPNREGLLLDTGNAGALKILIDGRPAPSLGEDGDILRNIVLSPEAFEN